MRLAERALRLAVVERIGEPEPLVEIGLRLGIGGGDLVGDRAEALPQRRILIGEIRRGRRRLDLGGRNFGLPSSEADHGARSGGGARRVAERDRRIRGGGGARAGKLQGLDYAAVERERGDQAHAAQSCRGRGEQRQQGNGRLHDSLQP